MGQASNSLPIDIIWTHQDDIIVSAQDAIDVEVLQRI